MDECFVRVKELLLQSEALSHFVVGRDIEIHTDASETGIGGLLV